MTSTDLGTADTITEDGEHQELPPVKLTGQGALALRPDQTGWNPVQEAALAQIGLADAPQADRLVFLHQCQRTGLDPFARQIYMIGRKDQGVTKWTIQTGIDGFRAVAEEHPEYQGQTDPEWCGPDGQWVDVWLDREKPPVAARVGVHRGDRLQPIMATVLFAEFAQYKPDYNGRGAPQLTTMWKTKSAHMIAKCAEAGALRKAFPQRLSGLVTDDEAAAFERLRAQQVPSTRVSPSAVSSDELAGDVIEGEAMPAADRPSSGAATGRTTPTRGEAPDPGQHARMTAAQSRELFPLMREAKDAIGGRNEWASQVLGRRVSTFGDLTEADADQLLVVARELGTEPVDAEVVDEPPTPDGDPE